MTLFNLDITAANRALANYDFMLSEFGGYLTINGVRIAHEVDAMTVTDLLSALGAKLAAEYETTQKQFDTLSVRLDEVAELATTSAKANLEREALVTKLAKRVVDLDSQWAECDLPNIADQGAKLDGLDAAVGRIFKRLDSDENDALELVRRVSALEDFDFAEAVAHGALNDFDFSECSGFAEHVESVIENFNFRDIVNNIVEDFDMSDDIRGAVQDFDFSRQVDDAVRSAMDELDFTDYRSFTRAVENEVSEQVVDAVFESLRSERAVDIISDTVGSVLNGGAYDLDGIKKDINALEETIEIVNQALIEHKMTHPAKSGVVTAEEIREALVGRTLTVTIA